VRELKAQSNDGRDMPLALTVGLQILRDRPSYLSYSPWRSKRTIGDRAGSQNLVSPGASSCLHRSRGCMINS